MYLAEFKEEDIQDNNALFLFIYLHNESYISFTRFTFSVIFPEYLYLSKLKLMANQFKSIYQLEVSEKAFEPISSTRNDFQMLSGKVVKLKTFLILQMDLSYMAGAGSISYLCPLASQ